MFLNAHSFYSVDEYFTYTDDMYYWLYDCVNVSYTVIFYFSMFMTYSTSYCLVTVKDLWNVYMYVGMYVCIYVRLFHFWPSRSLSIICIKNLSFCVSWVLFYRNIVTNVSKYIHSFYRNTRTVCIYLLQCVYL